jgi:hypothetical protein
VEETNALVPQDLVGIVEMLAVRNHAVYDALAVPQSDTSHGCEIVAEESKALGASFAVLKSRSSFKAQKRRTLLGIIFLNSNDFSFAMFEASKFDLILVAGVLLLLRLVAGVGRNRLRYSRCLGGPSNLEVAISPLRLRQAQHFVSNIDHSCNFPSFISSFA